MFEKPRCDYRVWVKITEDDQETPNKDGSWSRKKHFHGAQPCGRPAMTSIPQKGGKTLHRCATHLREGVVRYKRV